MNEEIERRFLASAARLGAKNPQIVEDDSDGDDIAGASSTRFYLEHDDEDGDAVELASGMLSQFPNCCGIAVLGEAAAEHPKWLKWIFELREAVARSEKRGLLVQTHRAKDIATKRVMRQLHWRTTCPNWLNPNSGNRVTMWTKVLR